MRQIVCHRPSHGPGSNTTSASLSDERFKVVCTKYDRRSITPFCTARFTVSTSALTSTEPPGKLPKRRTDLDSRLVLSISNVATTGPAAAAVLSPLSDTLQTL